MSTLDLRHGDSRELLKTLPDNSVDSCVCDPPYDLTTVTKRFGADNAAPAKFGTDGAFQRAAKGFMGCQWDGTGIAFDPEFWAEVLRVLKPGGHLLAFGGTRTSHWMVCAIDTAGFEIRDTVFVWTYATGFPKSHDVAHGIDKLNGTAGNRGHAIAVASKAQPNGRELPSGGDMEPYKAASEAAQAWEGWGTALKPSAEPLCVARKPLSESSVARNVLQWGTGGINIDGCRIVSLGETTIRPHTERRFMTISGENTRPSTGEPWEATSGSDNGRWPANTILVCLCEGEHLPGCHVRELDQQSGVTSSKQIVGDRTGRGNSLDFGMARQTGVVMPHDDAGGASRFFYVAKPSQRERGEGNIHPTVKPVTLLKYLIRLVTPPGGVTLDPFMGSGTAGIAAQWEGVNYIGFERETPYFNIARHRCGDWREYEDEAPRPEITKRAQLSIFDQEAA
jgi:DNA modification methylase